MEWWIFLLMFFGALVVVMLTALPMAFAFLLINLVAVILLWGGPGLNMLALNMRDTLSTFTLLPIPMFVLLGEVMFHSGMGFRVIDVLDEWLGQLPGRLGLLAVSAATLFSTMSGSTIATTSMLGSVLTPEMERRGYKKPIAIGSIMGAGGLAMIIPPSGLAVLLASIAEISIGGLLIAGIIPGLIIAFFYSSYIVLRCKFQPSVAPSYEVISRPVSKKVVDTAKYVLPLGLIIFLVIGLIFLGISTPTEAAAMGCLGSFLLAALYRRLTWDMVKTSIMSSIQVSVMVFMIILTSANFAQLLSYTGATRDLSNFVSGLGLVPIAIVIAMQAVMIFLGMFLSLLPIIMICAPIFFPLVLTLGFNPLWFGLMMLINLEIAQTTPPFGTLLFVMKGVTPPDTTFGDIWRAGIPFLLCDLTAMLLILVFPPLGLWLPSIMR